MMWWCLAELITALRAQPQDKKVRLGFCNPHSYRGFYDELAFEPLSDTTVGEMLTCAEKAVGSTYTGYKGGEYEMWPHTRVWINDPPHPRPLYHGPYSFRYRDSSL